MRVCFLPLTGSRPFIFRRPAHHSISFSVVLRSREIPFYNWNSTAENLLEPYQRILSFSSYCRKPGSKSSVNPLLFCSLESSFPAIIMFSVWHLAFQVCSFPVSANHLSVGTIKRAAQTDNTSLCGCFRPDIPWLYRYPLRLPHND